MSVVWVIVAVVAVVLFAAFVYALRGRAGAQEVTPGEVDDTAEVPELRAQVVAREAERAAAEEPEAVAEPAADAAPAAEVVPPKRPAKPEPSVAELRQRVEERLAESERMLGELRKAAEHDESVAQRAGAGMMEIMEEGLQEVRALAERKKWSQAKDKGEALRAQLSLMLQTARRERAS